MDAINRPRMPFKPQYIYSAGGALVVVIAALLLLVFLNTDDGAGGESVPADSIEQRVPDSAGSERAGGAFDPNAEAEIIRFRFDQKWDAFRVRDWDSYRAFCLGSAQEETSNDELQFFYTLLLADEGQTPQSFYMRIVDVTVMTPIDALVQYEPSLFTAAGNREVGTLLWTNVDGEWFSSICGY